MNTTATGVTEATRARILDAAFDAVADFGLSRLKMDDVAVRADLSRQTLYRYFPTKDDLLMALVLREEERFLDGVRAAFAAHDDLEGAVEDAVTFVLRYARRHPLLDRVLSADPEIILPYLTTRSRPVLDRAREVIGELLRDKARRGDRGLVDRAADSAARLLVSYAITPPTDPIEEIARAQARILGAALGKRGKEAR